MRTDRTERLLNLVLCLLGARRPVSRAAIRGAVPGYAECASDEAFERMFERDKDELRAMGVPIDTVLSPAGDVDGYRIDVDSYALPEVSFTGPELAVLGLAARAWSDAALGGSAQGALRKIEASAGELGTVADLRITMSTRPEAGDALLPVLWEAVRTRSVIGFTYRGLRDQDPFDRVIEPWGTVRYAAGWYVVGRDRSRGEPRAFRLSRMIGAIRVVDGPAAFAAVDHEDVRAIAARWADAPVAERALIELHRGAGARLRLRADAGPDGTIAIRYADARALAGEICELGDAATVREPASLRAEVMAGLEAVLTAHEEQA